MFQHANPKCANPACPTCFHWKKGGKFFRFRQEQVNELVDSTMAGPPNLHQVEHFWLCRRCAEMFTLVYVPGQEIVLRVVVAAPATSDLLPASPMLQTKTVSAF